MFAPGYYKLNYRGLRFRELVRMRGLQRAFKSYLITRFKRSDIGEWMPSLWADIECTEMDLSEEFRVAAKRYRLEFERLGFTECGFLKGTKSLNPRLRDLGSIAYLDPTRRHLGQLFYIRQYIPAERNEVAHVSIAFTATFEHGSLSCTNTKNSFDPPDENEVIRLVSCDVNFIYQHFLKQLQHRSAARQFPDIESLRRAFDARQVRKFEEHARRRLYVPMTDQEVAAAKVKLQNRNSEIAFTPPPNKLRLGVWIVIIVAFVSLKFIRYHPLEKSDLLEYQGQQFKMKKAYSTYEDYKDDPDNLDTNKLDRIERVMVSAKIPLSFKNRESFIDNLFRLKFPGYGLGGIEAAQTDDGSTLDAESVEIPQRDKDRYIVVRQSAGQLNVVDDFVFGSSTNTIQHVKLEKHKLRYYDKDGKLVREKQL